MKDYSRDYYKDRHNETVYPAKVILSRVINILPAINSVVDVGCRVGTWLSVLKDNT